ncbi:MAG: hypothetical protein LBL96_02870 [Clostridiales bacterium]|jgi:hypothetical protein|nr:hypothetical protein [Clostridiales bacterium]
MLKVGLILYSVRDEMAKDPLGTIEKVGKLGYKYLEACSHNAINDNGIGFGVSAKEVKDRLAISGSKIISAHIFPYEMADRKAIIGLCQHMTEEKNELFLRKGGERFSLCTAPQFFSIPASVSPFRSDVA